MLASIGFISGRLGQGQAPLLWDAKTLVPPKSRATLSEHGSLNRQVIIAWILSRAADVLWRWRMEIAMQSFGTQ